MPAASAAAASLPLLAADRKGRSVGVGQLHAANGCVTAKP
jgi:hypothetical protein